VTRSAPGTLTATLAGAAGQTVQVQHLDHGQWLNVTTYRAEATHKLTGLVTGQTYRVVVPSTISVAGVTSAGIQA
jgi:serine protease